MTDAHPQHKDAYIAQRQRGEEARRVVESPYFRAAFDEEYADLKSLIWADDTPDEAKLLSIVVSKLLRRVEANIVEHIQTGNWAKDSLSLLEDD